MTRLLNSKQPRHRHNHKAILSVINLTFGYNRKSQELKDLSVDFHKGEWTTILGPNGSGKSTLAKNIVRVIKPRAGEILIDGENIRTVKNKTYAQRVAYIPQIMEVPGGISVNEFVSFGRNPWLGIASKMSKKDHEIVKEALMTVGILDLQDKMMEDLSGGQRQKATIALAIAQTAEIIIFDEPTTYLDIKAQYEVLELMSGMHSKGKTIITVLHDLNQAVQYSDELVVLKDGMLYKKGTPEKIVTSKMIADVYGVKTQLIEQGSRRYITDVKIIDKPDL